jgi:hypothetical protein
MNVLTFSTILHIRHVPVESFEHWLFYRAGLLAQRQTLEILKIRDLLFGIPSPGYRSLPHRGVKEV